MEEDKKLMTRGPEGGCSTLKLKDPIIIIMGSK
jgi:hypothetical protein